MTGGIDKDVRQDAWAFLYGLYPFQSTRRYVQAFFVALITAVTLNIWQNLSSAKNQNYTVGLMRFEGLHGGRDLKVSA